MNGLWHIKGPSLYKDDPYFSQYGQEIEPLGHPSLVHEDNRPSWTKIAKLADGIFEKIEKIFKYILKITKNIFKAISLAYAETEEKIGKIIAYLGIVSIINIPFNIRSLCKQAKKLNKCIRLQDVESSIWAALNVAVNPLKIANTLLSFGKSVDKLIGIAWISLFSFATLPLTVALLAYDTVKSIYHTIVLAIELASLPISIDPNNPERLKNYLEEKVGATEAEKRTIKIEVLKEFSLSAELPKKMEEPEITGRGIIFQPHSDTDPSSSDSDPLTGKAKQEYDRRITLLKDKKINQLSHRTDKKIVDYMTRAKEYIEADPEDTENLKNTLADLQKLMVRKLTLHSLDSLFCVAEVVILTVASIFPALHAAVPLTFTCCNTGFSIFKEVYYLKWFTHGLINRHCVHASKH